MYKNVKKFACILHVDLYTDRTLSPSGQPYSMHSEDGRPLFAFSGTSDNDFHSSSSVHQTHSRTPESCESTSETGSLAEDDHISSRRNLLLTPTCSVESQSEPLPPHQLYPVNPQNPRQRTTQACGKCRERKTKCSGHRPVCLRCNNRGLRCEYSVRETRIRAASTRARNNNFVTTSGSIRQPDISGRDRPTPAIHSRMGGSQTNAFASPLNPYIPSPNMMLNSKRLHVTSPSAPRRDDSKSGTSIHPTLQHPCASWHPTTSPTVATPSQRERVHASEFFSSPLNRNGVLDHKPSIYPLSISHPNINEQENITFGHYSSQQPYPFLHVHVRGAQNAFASMPLPRSSSFDQIDSSLPLYTVLLQPQELVIPPPPIPPSCSIETDFFSPYTSSCSTASSFDGERDHNSPFNGSTNSSDSTITTSSQLELACPTPSAPIDYHALDGPSVSTFEYGTLDPDFFNINLHMLNRETQRSKYSPGNFTQDMNE